MRQFPFQALGAGILLFFATACSDGGNGQPTGGSSSGSGGGGNGSCVDGLAEAANAEFCAGSKAATDCAQVTAAYHDQLCGVPILAPGTGTELSRSANVEEYSGSGPPDIGCFAPSGYPAKPGTPQNVKVSGIAKIFSHGCQSNDLDIAIFKVKRTGGTDEADLGEQVGAGVTTASDCTIDGVTSTEDDCSGRTRYECKYEYDGVPTETELVIRTQGALWASLYDYNVYISNSAVMNGVWNHDVRALASDDYGVISQVAIGGPITIGHGAIAGEVHDCGDVRLIGATVDVEVQKKIVTYFTSDEAHPLPDLSAKNTTALSLYAAMDVVPGVVTVAAAGRVNGALTTVGYFRARVFPDSVTAVTFRGLRPFQVP